MSLLKGIDSDVTNGLAQDAYLAGASPSFFLVKQSIRGAAAMSFFIVLSEGLHWDVFTFNPASRLKFVIFWAVSVSIIELVRVRYHPVRTAYAKLKNR